MNHNIQTHGRRQRLAALAALVVLALAARPIQAAGPGLTGYVVGLDVKGQITGPVPGAVIEFKGTAVVKATADKIGRYQVDLRPGTYSYKITAAGFKDEDEGRKLSTTLSDGYQVKNFGLTKGKTDPKHEPPKIPDVVVGILQGDVVEKAADDKEIPIPGAMVYLRNTDVKSPLIQVTTREHDDKTKPGQPQGHFELVLEAGTFTASVVATGFEPFKDVQPIEIVVGKTATRRFVLSRVKPAEPVGQGIEGTVKFADTSAVAASLPPVKVSIGQVGGPSGSPAVTFSPDASGRFQRNLPTGRYRLAVEAKGYRTYPRTLPDVDVLHGTYTKVTIYLVSDMLFEGQVYERVGRRLRPLSGATVELLKSGDPASKAERLTTGKSGYVSTKLAEEGNYVALARLAGYKDAKDVKVAIRANGENSAKIVLERSGVATPVPPPKGFDLTIVAKSGAKPVMGAEITLKRVGKLIASGKSGESGGYLAAGLDAGFYIVEVTKNGFKANNKSVTLYKTETVEIALTPDSTVPVIAEVTVPNVRQLLMPQARKAIEDAGLTFRSANDVLTGKVKSQTPAAGSKVKPETPVQVAFDGEPGSIPKPIMVRVPDLRGRSLEQAKQMIEDARLVFRTADPKLVTGGAVSQTPVAGTEVALNSPVVVTFQPVPRPILVRVPDLRGRSLEQAKQLIETARLEFRTADPKLVTGGAVSQSPVAGTEVALNSPVVVTFQPAPVMVRVPDLRGRSFEQAKQIVEAARLVFRTADPKLVTGGAVAQTPVAGTEVALGSSVAVTFQPASKPMPPPNMVRVPDLKGKSNEEAKRLLQSVGLVAKYARPAHENAKGGTVSSQTPAAGTQVAPGSSVTLEFVFR